MIRDSQIPELDSFRAYESTIPFSLDNALESLVVPAGNDLAPVHGWFKFKEGFSRNLLRYVYLKHLLPTARPLNFLDPFCGSGTSLVSAQELISDGVIASATGIERNPFIAFVARAKTSWPDIDPDRLLRIGASALKNAPRRIALPALSSIREERCITRYMARRIIACRDAILRQSQDATTNAALLALAACVETVSKIRKDGRALRITGSKGVSFDNVFTERLTCMAQDLRVMQRNPPKASATAVIAGDGRKPLSCGVKESSVDLILTSPPYPNNIDYTEVYKLELWLLGFVDNTDDFYRLRHKTVRSHPIIAKPDKEVPYSKGLWGESTDIMIPLLKRVTASEKWRGEMLRAYFEDILGSLREHFSCLRPGGREAIVVGNSLHGCNANPILVATDLFISALARQAGFRVLEVKAARSLKRRLIGNHFLRESLVVLEKPSLPVNREVAPEKTGKASQNRLLRSGIRD